MTKAFRWKTRLPNESYLVKDSKGNWAIPLLCVYCKSRYIISAEKQGKSGKCAKCKRTLFIPFVPESLQIKCESCGNRRLATTVKCPCTKRRRK